MTKALTYYALKKDEVGKTLTKTQLIKEAANAYGVPEATFRGKRHKTRKSKQRATSSELPGEEKEVGS